MIRIALAVFASTLALAAPQAARAADDDLLAVSPEQLGLLWTPDRTHYNVALAGAERQSVGGGCVTATLVIEKDGSTSDVRIVRSVPAGAYEVSAKRLFAKMRFTPTARNTKPEPTYSAMTITVEPMAGHQKTLGSNRRREAPDPETLRKACAVDSLLQQAAE